MSGAAEGSSPPRVLVVVDGTALAYRSHFAFINRPLTTKKGEVTSAVFGFILGLRKIFETLKPDRVAVVFDPPGPTFRHAMYREYKATRERMPDDLRSQLPWIDRYLEAAGIPRIVISGVEADDVLATLAQRAAAQGYEACIVSNDKDLAQVVGDGVCVVTLGKGNDPPRVLQRDGVIESYGVPPEQIVDYLSLTGDSSDNVPGVAGVGAKTAARLLQEYGDLEHLFAAAPSMKAGKLRDGLLAGEETCYFARSLVRLKTDVEGVVEPETLAARPPDQLLLNALFDELEFHSLKKEAAPTEAVSDLAGYRCLTTLDEVSKLVDQLRASTGFAFDTETTSIDPMRADLVGLSFCSEPGKACYLPVAHENAENLPWPETRELLRGALEAESVPKWGQNVKYDLLVLRRHGIEVKGVDFDSMLASYVIDPSRRSHSMDELARDRLGLSTIPLTRLIGSGKNQILISQAPLSDVVSYAAEDADVTYKLRQVLEPEVLGLGLERLFREVELPLLHVLADMEQAGVRLDVPFLQKLSGRMGTEIQSLEAEAHRAAGEAFNLGSPKQVAEILFTKIGLKPGRRTKTGFSTDADTLAELESEHEVVGILLRHRELSKLKSTYVDALPALVHPNSGRLHTNYNQAVAATGRLSSSDPNLQNVPIRTEEGRAIRKAFIPREEGWVLLSCDYSQIELRILAHMAKDEPLVHAFQSGVDVHRVTASQIFEVDVDRVTPEQRAQAKTINFGVIYGMGAVNLGKSLGISTKEASRFIEAYFGRYPGVRRFIDESQRHAREEMVVSTLAGRRRPIPEIASQDPRTRAFGERIAINTPIQGTAADILKIAMIRTHDALRQSKFRGVMILTVHDELVFDVPVEEREAFTSLVVREMESAMALDVPLQVDFGAGNNWSEAH